jgi:tetratricopeptide (TPR) repeat protein
MKYIVVLSLVLLYWTGTMAQHTVIRGQVFLQNSKTSTGTLQSIAGVYIQADAATPTVSDAQGRFTLTFSGPNDLQQTRVVAQKQGLLLMNDRELRSVTIGRQAPVHVYMTDSSLFAQEQAILNKVHLQIIVAEKDRLIGKLKGDSASVAAALAEMETRFDREFTHAGEAREFLEKELVKAKERLPERMAALARVNLDFASERYKRAYFLFREGQMELALLLLDSVDVDAETFAQRMEELVTRQGVTMAVRDSIDAWADQLISTYTLKSELHNLKFEYRKSANMMDHALVLLLRMKRGAEDLEVADLHWRMGRILRDAGDYHLSYSHFAKDLVLKRQLLRGNDPVLAMSLNDVASVLSDLGNYSEALKLAKEACAIRKSSLAPDHPEIAMSLNNLAQLYLATSRFQDALMVQLQAIAILEKSKRGEPVDLLRCFNNLSIIYGRLGKYRKAMKSVQIAIHLGEEQLHSDHPDLANARNTLAMVLESYGDNSEAIAVLRQAMATLEKILGPENIRLAACYGNMAALQSKEGHYFEAIEAIMRDIEITEHALGVNHPDLAVAYGNLASIRYIIYDYSGAFEASRKAIRILFRTFPVDHANFAILYGQLANILQDMGHYESALIYYMLAIRSHGSNSPPTGVLAMNFNNISDLLLQLGDSIGAMKAIQKAIAIQKEVLPEDHPDLGGSYGNMAYILYASRQLTDAKAALLSAIRIDTMAWGMDYIGLAAHYRRLGMIYLELESPDSSLYYGTKVLHIYDQVDGIVVIDRSEAEWILQRAHMKIGQRHHQSKEYLEAIAHYRHALESDDDAPLASLTYNAMGLCHYFRGEYALAIEAYEQSIRLDSSIQPNYLNNTALVYMRLGNFQEAEKRIQELEKLTPKEYSPWRLWAVYYGYQKDMQAALLNLEKALQLGYADWTWIETEEALASLRSTNRYQRLKAMYKK